MDNLSSCSASTVELASDGRKNSDASVPASLQELILPPTKFGLATIRRLVPQPLSVLFQRPDLLTVVIWHRLQGASARSPGEQDEHLKRIVEMGRRGFA